MVAAVVVAVTAAVAAVAATVVAVAVAVATAAAAATTRPTIGSNKRAMDSSQTTVHGLFFVPGPCERALRMRPLHGTFIAAYGSRGFASLSAFRSSSNGVIASISLSFIATEPT